MAERPVDRLAASPCSNPDLPLDAALAAYSSIGYRKFEVFTSWVKSAFDIDADPASYRTVGRSHGMEFASLHLPPVGDDRDETLMRSVQAARFAEQIAAGVVLFKATSRDNYIAAAGPFLDTVDGLAVTPVLQNHYGTPISTLSDFREVIEGINDPRMKTLLEVGHFHSAGVSWREGAELLGQSIALVHVKDQIGAECVPFGEGEIDLEGLFGQMEASGYRGNYVVEMELKGAATEHIIDCLRRAREYVASVTKGV